MSIIFQKLRYIHTAICPLFIYQYTCCRYLKRNSISCEIEEDLTRRYYIENSDMISNADYVARTCLSASARTPEPAGDAGDCRRG